MKSKYSKRRKIAIVPILLLLGAAVVALIIVMAMTGDKADSPSSSSQVPSDSQTASTTDSAPSSSLPSSSESGSDSSESESDPSEPSNSETSQSSKSSSSSSSTAPSSSTSASSDASQQDKYYEKDKPLLVNPTNKVPEGYSPKLASIVDSYKMDDRAAVAFKDMLGAAWEDGISLWVVSAYRSNDKQTINFNNEVKKYEGKGYTAAEAYTETAKWIAVPGTSEHETGLAVDVNSLYTSFEDTKEFKWLMANCAEFGFVLRFPKDKVDITQISYEPWHYRYVGSNHAGIIMDKGICLEEYLSGDY